MKWTSNNVACVTVWSTLQTLNQIGERLLFKNAGDKCMADLTFFPKDGSDKVVEARAKSLSLQLDKFFRRVTGAKYESGVNTRKAVDSMAKLLGDNEKTISDLADVADNLYRFYGEGAVV